ncbi:MAG: hypothetical protein JNK11_11075 [Alphaproteobacteria bacterium]|nr:hypothetical protein [Alphaproteobacteria bacterium]
MLQFESDNPPGERSVDLLAAVARFRPLGTHEQLDINEFADALTWDVRVQHFRPEALVAFGLLGLGFMPVLLGAMRAVRQFAIFAIQLDSGESMLFAVPEEYGRRVVAADVARRRRRRLRRRWWPF